MSHASILREGGSRRTGRRVGNLSRSLALLDDLSPRLRPSAARWGFGADPAAGGLSERPGDPGSEPVGGSGPTRSDPAVPAPVPIRPDPDRDSEVGGLTADQREQALKLLGAGAGRAATCEQLGVTLREFCETIVADHGFRDSVLTAEEARINDCEMTIYEQAVSGSLAAAVAYTRIKRDHKIEQARLANESKVATAYVETATADLNGMSSLSNDDFRRLRGLTARLSQGVRLTPAESIEFAALFGKSLTGSGPIPDEPGPLNIELSELEDLFGVNSEGD